MFSELHQYIRYDRGQVVISIDPTLDILEFERARVMLLQDKHLGSLATRCKIVDAKQSSEESIVQGIIGRVSCVGPGNDASTKIVGYLAPIQSLDSFSVAIGVLPDDDHAETIGFDRVDVPWFRRASLKLFATRISA